MIPFSKEDIHSHETRAEKDVLVMDEKFYDQILQGQKLLELIDKRLLILQQNLACCSDGSKTKEIIESNIRICESLLKESKEKCLE